MRFSTRWTTILFLVALTAANARAEAIYRWVDREGVVHYSDEAPENGIVGDLEARPEVGGESSEAASGGESTPSPSAPSAPAGVSSRRAVEVDIYTTSWCGYCREAKQYFRSRGIAFREYDVGKDAAAARRLKRYNPSGGVPVTVIDGKPIVGYAPAAFARALAE